MKIIHTADIHLDSLLKAHLSPEKAKERRSEILQTFFSLLAYAADNGVTAVIISGDLFDAGNVTVKTRKSVEDAIKAYPSIDIIYLLGNHDDKVTLFEERDPPQNFKTFKRGVWTTYTYGEVAITGIETCDSTDGELYNTLSLDANATNILVMHGEVSEYKTDAIYLPSSRNRGVDYLALGHYHSYGVFQLDNRGIYCYSGALEGRGFDECGDKGFVLLNAEKRRIDGGFIPFAKRRLETVSVDISGTRSMFAVEKAVFDALEGVDSGSLVKVVLTGKCDAGLYKDIDALVGLLNSRFYFGKVSDESGTEFDPEYYMNDISLKGEFIRMVLADGSLQEKEREDIIKLGLETIS